ncbi:MFS transporter [Ignatzschineria sp. LJL83]
MDKHNKLLLSATNKNKRKLLPMLLIMFSLAMLDRSNVGFVKQYLEIDSGINAAAYAFGAGVFFLGYAILEIPSNLMLHRVGAKVWLSRIMVSWGIVCGLMMFSRDPISFYILRFLLGVTEAGFFPGVILYLTYWFPDKYRGQAYGWFYLGVPLAMMFGAPFSGLLLELPTMLGMKNWQWMFVIQGILTVFVGIFAYFWLESKPSTASWLTDAEKEAISLELEKDLKNKTSSELPEEGYLLRTLKDLTVWKFVFVYFSIQVSVYGVLFYLPSKFSELLNTSIGLKVGLYVAIPWVVTLLLLPVITKLTDKYRRWRVMAMVMLACAVIGITLATQTNNLFVYLIVITIAVCGFIIVQPIFWNLPTQYLSGKSAAAGTALIGAVGNLGGFTAPNLKNYAEQLMGNQTAGLLALAVVSLVGVLVLLTLKSKNTVKKS